MSQSEVSKCQLDRRDFRRGSRGGITQPHGHRTGSAAPALVAVARTVRACLAACSDAATGRLAAKLTDGALHAVALKAVASNVPRCGIGPFGCNAARFRRFSDARSARSVSNRTDVPTSEQRQRLLTIAHGISSVSWFKRARTVVSDTSRHLAVLIEMNGVHFKTAVSDPRFVVRNSISRARAAEDTEIRWPSKRVAPYPREPFRASRMHQTRSGRIVLGSIGQS